MKNPPGRNSHGIQYVSDLLKFRRPHKKSPHYRIVSPRKVSPGRQFTGKNPFRLGGRRAARIFRR